jgi:hypothetical protein
MPLGGGGVAVLNSDPLTAFCWSFGGARRSIQYSFADFSVVLINKWFIA